MAQRTSGRPRRRVVRVATLRPVPDLPTDPDPSTPAEPANAVAGHARRDARRSRPSTLTLLRPAVPAVPAAPTSPAARRPPARAGEDGPTPFPSGRGRRARHSAPPWRQPRLILAVLLLVGLVALVLTGRQWYDQHQLASAHQAALAAARQTTVDFVTISASTVDRDLQRVVAGATGDFKDEFTRGLPQVRQAVIENKVQSTGTILRAALVSGDLDSAVVLVAVDASVHNTGAPDGHLSHYRIQVDVAKDPDSQRWLVARLQFVG